MMSFGSLMQLLSDGISDGAGMPSIVVITCLGSLCWLLGGVLGSFPHGFSKWKQAARFLKGLTWIWRKFSSVTFYQSKQSQGQLRFKERGIDSTSWWEKCYVPTGMRDGYWISLETIDREEIHTEFCTQHQGVHQSMRIIYEVPYSFQSPGLRIPALNYNPTIVYPRMWGWFHIWKVMNPIHCINRKKGKNPYDHLNRCIQKKYLTQSNIH